MKITILGCGGSFGSPLAWNRHGNIDLSNKRNFRTRSSVLIEYKNTNILLKGKTKGRNLIDYFFTFGMSLICTIYFKKVLFDINAQPKMFYKDFKYHLFKDAPNDFSLDLHFLLSGKKNNFKILNHPVYFNKRNAGIAKGGGGSLKNKIKLIKRTFNYILETKKKWK